MPEEKEPVMDMDFVILMALRVTLDELIKEMIEKCKK